MIRAESVEDYETEDAMPTKVDVSIETPISVDGFYLPVAEDVGRDFERDLDSAIEDLTSLKDSFKEHGGLRGAFMVAAREALEAALTGDSFATLQNEEGVLVVVVTTSSDAVIRISFDAAVHDMIDILEDNTESEEEMAYGRAASARLRMWADKIDEVCVRPNGKKT